MKILKFLGLLFFGIWIVILVTALVVGNAVSESLFNEDYVRDYYDRNDVPSLVYSTLETKEYKGIAFNKIHEEEFTKTFDELSLGVMDYVFDKTDTLPVIELSEFKDTVEEELHIDLDNLESDVEISSEKVIEMIGNLRVIDKTGQMSVNELKMSLNEMGVASQGIFVDKLLEIYVTNREEEAAVIAAKVLDTPELQLLSMGNIPDDFDLNEVFNEENRNNVFLLMRNGRILFKRYIYHYLPIYIGLLALVIAIMSFSTRGTFLTYGIILMFTSVISYILHLCNYLIIGKINGLENPFLIEALNQLVQDVFKMTTRFSLILFLGFVVCIIICFLFVPREKQRYRSVRTTLAILVFLTVGYFGMMLNDEATNYSVEIDEIQKVEFEKVIGDYVDRQLNNIE